MKINLKDTIKDFEKNYVSNPNAVKKGVALFKEVKVEYKPYDDGIIMFSADVPDEDGIVTHSVRIKVYKMCGMFVDGNCTCRPNQAGKLLCKHIVAATLAVQNEMFSERQTVLLNGIDVTALEHNAAKIKDGIRKYANIMARLHTCDVSQDREFQKAFNGFYRVRRDTDWQKVFYDFMEQSKHSTVNFGDILTHVYENTDKVEASFSSKLLATLNPEMPVWDKNVLSQLNIKEPSPTCADRIKRIAETYSILQKWYADYLETDNANEVIGRFDELFPNSGLTALKKIDLALWSMGVKK